MKKVVLAAVSTCCGVSAAYAQSSVTLYGIVDTGITYVSNAQTNRTTGHPQWSMMDGTSNGPTGSRWGVRGSEDLGAGLKTIFVLENGFTETNGAMAQGGDLFGRQAYVGLSSGAGTVTLGRQYDTSIDFVSPFVSLGQWAGISGAHADDVDNMSSNRINNSIKYTSINYGGLTFGGLYALGGVPGSPGRDQIWSVGASYARSDLTVAAGYLNARNPNFGFFADNPNASATGNNFGSAGSATAPERNPIYAGYASANTQQIFIAGAAYKIAAATLGVVYSNTRFSDLGSNSVPNMFLRGSTAGFNDIEVNLRYQFTPALFAGFAYNWTRSSSEMAGGIGAMATYNQFAAGVDYLLSKRTDVYFVALYQHASGTDSLGQPAVASLAGLTPSANSKQVATRLALRTRF